MPNYDLGTAEGKIVLDSSGVDNAVNQANSSMGRLGKGVQSAERLGRDLTLGLTVPIVAAGGYALKTAIDFETAFAGVTKTISATDEQIADLRQGIIDMSLEMPASTTEIAAVAEAAGQLGIEVSSIEEFTRVMIALGVATNLSSTEAADAIAHVTNIMGTSVDDFGRFGATLVGLGNDSAATESEILEMGNRIAGIANLTGSTEAEMLSLAAALSSVGVNAESGGTSVTKTIKDFDEWALSIQEANFNVEDMTDNAAAFYQMIGGNQAVAEEFISLNGIQRFEFFIQKMQEAEGGGQNLIALLKDMGLQEIRQSDAILRMVGAGDLLTETLAVGNTAWEENTALTKEAGKRYETTASQLQIARNKADNAARIFGEAMIPILIQMLDAVTPLLEGLALLAEAFSSLPDPVQKIILGFLAFLAIIGPVLFIGSKMVGTIMALSKVVSVLAGAFKLLGLAAAVNPFVLIALAIAALVVGFIVLYKRSEKFRNFINNLGKEIAEIWGHVVDFFKSLPDFFKNLWKDIVGHFNTAKDAVVGAWNSVVDFFTGVGSAISDAFTTAKDAVAGFVTGAIDRVIDFFTSLPGIVASGVTTAFNAFVNFLTQLPERIAYFLGFALGRWIKFHIDLVQLVIQIGIDVIQAVVNFLTQLPGIVANFLSTVFSLFLQWGSDLLSFIIQTGTELVQFLIQKLTEFITWLPGFLLGVFQQFVSWGAQLISWAISTFTNFVTSVINAITGLPGQIAGIFGRIISALPGFASSAASGALNIGKSMVSGLLSGIGDLGGLIMDLIRNAINGIGDLGRMAFDKMKSIGSSLWNGFKSGLGISSPSYIEEAAFTMRDNLTDVIQSLGGQIRQMQTLSRGIPGVAAEPPMAGSAAALALRAVGPSTAGAGSVSATPLGLVVQGPLVGEIHTDASEADALEWSRRLADLTYTQLEAQGNRAAKVNGAMSANS